MKKRLLCAAIVLVLLTSALFIYFRYNCGFEAHFINIGQGDAILLKCDGKTMLIDGGPISESETLYTYLKYKAHISRLDYIIATHPHADHVGGLSAAVNAFPVGKIFSPVLSYTEFSFIALQKEMKARNLNFTLPLPGNKIKLGSAEITFLAPTKLGSNMNDNSIVIMVHYDNVSLLFVGDAETTEEDLIMRAGEDVSADVLKLGHHGSETSSSERFLNAVSPTCAVISCGIDNSYGHPHEATLSRLKNHDISVYRTDIQGNIVLKVRYGRIMFKTEKNIADQKALYSPLVQKFPKNSDDMLAEAPYIANANTKKLHRNTCENAKKLNIKNIVKFTNKDDAFALGYEPCGLCKP